MLFSSYPFLFQFLPVVALVFAAARLHSPRAGIFVLMWASLVFYGVWRPIYLLLLLGSINFNFWLGLLMLDPKRRRQVGTLGVALNLAALGYFKYTNFLIDSVAQLAGTPLPLVNVVLPLGISFFTFQQIAYLVDVMRGAPVERDPVSYTLFVSFFPHLIAGPLVHHSEMIPQFKRARSSRSAVLAARGFAIFVAGLFKKVVIADSLAQFVSPAFAHADAGGSIPAAWAWLATSAYTFQIYFDFSGYSDMAIGLALMFGIRLPVNFRSPYKALSIIDFWRRWHITLSRFLKDYLYISLGGNRRGPVRRYINLLATMLLGGLWHGAGWNFLIWGGLHGLYLCINHGWQALFARQPLAASRAAPVWKMAAWLLTFTSVVVAWVFFRAATFTGAMKISAGLVGQTASGTPYQSDGVIRIMGLPMLVGADWQLWIGCGVVLMSLLIATTLPNVPQLFRYREYRHAPEAAPLLRWTPGATWAVLIAVALVASMFGMWQRLEFLYFQF